MAVTNDGTNYFSGSFLGGVSPATLVADLTSIFTTLGIEFDFAPTNSDANVCWRPNVVAETLTGTITNGNANMVSSDTIEAGARFKHAILGGPGGSALCPILLNSSLSGTTTINSDFNSPNIIQSTLRSSLAGAECWAVVTDHSLATFCWVDANNYSFVTTGIYDNSAGHAFPDDTFGFSNIRDSASERRIFSNRLNQTTGRAMYNFGSTTGNVPPNYDTTPVSGGTGDAWELFLRRLDNDFAIGNVPNCLQIDTTALGGLSIADVKNFDNITDGNDNIMGSTQDYFIYAGNYGTTGQTNDSNGDGIFMRVSSL